MCWMSDRANLADTSRMGKRFWRDQALPSSAIHTSPDRVLIHRASPPSWALCPGHDDVCSWRLLLYVSYICRRVVRAQAHRFVTVPVTVMVLQEMACRIGQHAEDVEERPGRRIAGQCAVIRHPVVPLEATQPVWPDSCRCGVADPTASPRCRRGRADWPVVFLP